MKTVREAIDKGVRTICCNNGLGIELPDRWGRNDEAISPPKMIQGKPVFRWVFIRLQGQNKSDANISAIEHRSLYIDEDYSYFDENEYIAREREVNELISDNGGINEYLTDIMTNAWMY